MAWGSTAGIFIAAGRTSGSAAIAAASPDGILWTALSTTFGGATRVTGLAYSPFANIWGASMECACDLAWFSDDAYSTWSSDGSLGGSNWLNNVCYGAPTSQFVVGSSQDPFNAANTYASNTAGSLSPNTTPNLIERGSCGQFEQFGCAWGNGRFLFFGEGGSADHTIATSPLALNCAGVSGSDALFSTRGRHGAYGVADARWVALGEGTNTLAYSSDNGVTWTGLGTTLFSVGYFVAVRE